MLHLAWFGCSFSPSYSPLPYWLVNFVGWSRDQPLLIAWGVFLVGSAMTYLLAEVGGREYNLNFEWGAQVGLFILFYPIVAVLDQSLEAKGD